MDAARTRGSGSRAHWSPRALCVIAGLLCAVGVLSGGVLRASEVAHHPNYAAAAVVTLADGHGTAVRADHHVVTAPAATVTYSQLRTGAAQAPTTSVNVVTIDSVRTRGPPALA
jgi:hypothetical protein